MLFGIPFFTPNYLSESDMLKSISSMPQGVIDILEMYDVDIKKYISQMSGLIQTAPLLKDYDFAELDRNVLIEYAIERTDVLKSKEIEYLGLIEADINSGDYTFMEIYKILMMRVESRELEGDLSDLYQVKYKS